MGYIIYMAISGLFLSIHVIDSLYALICEYKNPTGSFISLSLLAVMNGVSFILYGLGFYWYCTDGSLPIMLFGLFISACTSLMMVCLNHIGAIDEYKDESRQATYILKQKAIKL